MKKIATLVLLCLAPAFGCTQSPPAPSSEAKHQTGNTPVSAIDHAIHALYGDIRTQTLRNGLQVYLKPIPGSPVVTTMVAYRVGSADEDLAHTGLAHYLEHLMFKGTDRLMPGDIDRMTLRNGGSNNAYTSNDHTVYHFDFAADRWQAALAIEADRMRNLRIDEKHEFDTEKGAVIEELRMNEDQPWDLEYKAILPLLFDDGPYGHPVIGEAAHVRDATAQVITDFYNRWYHPNNASIIIVGGFDPDQAMTTIRTLFESIPKAQLPARPEAKVVTRTAPARVHLDSKFAQPRLVMGFNGVKLGEPDDFVLDVISQILTGGKTSRLYRRLIEELEIAGDTSSANTAGIHPGWLAIDVELLPGQSLAQAEEVVVKELERLAREPVSEDDLSRVRRQIAASQIFHYEDVHELADSIAFGAVSGQPGYYGKYLANITRVSVADVQRVAKTLLDPKRRAVATSAPKVALNEVAAKVQRQPHPEPENLWVAGAEALRSPGVLPHLAGASQSLSLSHPKVLRLRAGRGTQPHPEGAGPGLKHPANSAAAFDLAHAKRHVLPNGLTLILLENHRLPIFLAAAEVADIHLLEPEKHPGVATLTGRLLAEGAGPRTGEEIARQIEDIGGTLNMHSAGGDVKVLSTDAKLALQTLLDCLARPRLENESFEREKSRLVAERDDIEQQAGEIAMQTFRKQVYGTHPFARPLQGRAEDVEKLRREDCIAFHRAAFTPGNTTLTLVGDFDAAQMLHEIEALTRDWTTAKVAPPAHDDPPLPERREAFYLSMPASSQLQVLIGHIGIRRDNPDYYKLLLLDYVLGAGSGFTDRLSGRLRDRQGLAYSVSGRIAGYAGVEPGLFLCAIGTEAKNLPKVREQIIEEITRMRDEPVTAQELADAKAYLLGSMPFNMTTTHAAAAMLLSIERHRLGPTYLNDFRKAIEAVSAADVQAAAKKYLHPDRLIIVAAGAINARGEAIE